MALGQLIHEEEASRSHDSALDLLLDPCGINQTFPLILLGMETSHLPQLEQNLQCFLSPL